MLTPVRSSQFKRDARKIRKRGKNLTKLSHLLDLLIRQSSLAPRYSDHPLKGSWKGYREVHIEPDWLLIYCVAGEELRLARTGSHSDLFN